MGLNNVIFNDIHVLGFEISVQHFSLVKVSHGTCNLFCKINSIRKLYLWCITSSTSCSFNSKDSSIDLLCNTCHRLPFCMYCMNIRLNVIYAQAILYLHDHAKVWMLITNTIQIDHVSWEQ